MTKTIPSHPVAPSKPEIFFASHPVFTTAELDAAFDKRWNGDPSARQSLLRYHHDRGRLLRIRRGFYAVVPPGTDPSVPAVDPYLIAARLAPDAVLAYQTAIAFHGCAHSLREEIVALSGASIRPYHFQGMTYRVTRPPRALARAGMADAETVTTERAGLDVRVTSLERTFVDLLDRPSLGGGWEEVWRSLESIPYLDVEAVLRYCLLLENATTTAAAGFFLDTHRETLLLEPRHLEPFRQRIPRQPHSLDRERPGRLVADWNLLVPHFLLESAWMEGA